MEISEVCVTIVGGYYESTRCGMFAVMCDNNVGKYSGFGEEELVSCIRIEEEVFRETGLRME